MIAVMTLLHFTRPVALPVALAIFGFLLLNPLVERIARTGIPRAAAVIAIQLALLAALASLVVATADPLVDWFKGLPQDLRAVRADLLEFRRPFAEAQESAKIIGELSELGEDDSYKVEVAQPNWLETLLERGPTMLLTLAVAGFLTLLLLLTAPRSVEALYAAPIAAGTRRRLAVCIGRAQRDVSTYLGWLVLINAVLGAVVALVMAVLDLNNPLMWGLMAGVANFVPYVGPLAVLVMIWIAGVVQFDSVLAGTWPALTFLVLTSLEGQLVTPAVLGRHLALPPPLIFVAILVLGWSWGLFGAFLAVPALVTGKAVLTYWPSRSMSDARRAARAARHREPVAEDAEQSSSVPTP
ncbi:MAG TPA: AI-2E family transporter [Steroidobacteraceae bacterium]|nr:AI-2E family transporter [Steroidobacteraceae bacterium]